MKRLTGGLHAVIAALLLTVSAGWAQDTTANNLSPVHEGLKTDKRALVGKYLALSQEQAQAFWPVYEDYQRDLRAIDERLAQLLQSYAADYNADALTDEKAAKLLADWIAIEQDDVKRRASYVPKVLKVLPPKKAARYLQIEHEYRTLLKYDLAVTVPLAP